MRELTWRGDVSFGTCLDVQKFLVEGLSDTEPSLVCLEAMSKLDVAGLQVLIAARLGQEALGLELCLADNSEGTRVNALAARLGCGEFSLKAVPHAK